MLNRQYFSHELLPVEVVDSILGVSVIVEVDESKLVLDRNIIDFSVFFQEIFDIFLPGPVANTAEVDTTSARHFCSSNIYSTLL